MTQAKVIARPTELPPLCRPFAGRMGDIVKVTRIGGQTYRTLAFAPRNEYEMKKADSTGRVYGAFKHHELTVYPSL